MFTLFTGARAVNDSTGGLVTYGPILAALASVAAVVVSFLGRKDKKTVDAGALYDTQTNTAIKGLTEAYDRINVERKEEAIRADAAERRCHELELALSEVRGRLADADAHIQGLADRVIGPKQPAPRKRTTPTSTKKTPAKKIARRPK